MFYPILTGLLACGGGAYYLYSQHKQKLAISYAFFGRSVWITGATSGIGKELAIALYKLGAHVILSGRSSTELQRVINEELLPLSQSELNTGPPQPSFVAFDMKEVAKDESIARNVIAEVLRCCPTNRLGAVFHNAGVSMRGLSSQTSYDVEVSIHQINYLAPVLLTKLLLQLDGLTADAYITVVSSIQGVLSLPLRCAYSSSKHAVQAYFKSLALELQLNKYIACNGNGTNTMSVTIVSPGYVQTNLSRNAFTGSGEKHGVLDTTTKNGYTAEYTAQQILKATANRTMELWLCPFVHKLAVFLQYLVPSFIANKLLKKARQELQDKSAAAASSS